LNSGQCVNPVFWTEARGMFSKYWKKLYKFPRHHMAQCLATPGHSLGLRFAAPVAGTSTLFERRKPALHLLQPHEDAQHPSRERVDGTPAIRREVFDAAIDSTTARATATAAARPYSVRVRFFGLGSMRESGFLD
jgi:hypothetical protein